VVRRILFQRHSMYYTIEAETVFIAFIQHMSRRPLSPESLAHEMESVVKFEKAIHLIDTANAADPKTDTLDGIEGPKEQIYGKRMMAWVERLNPAASDALKIAARAQHICRWEIPRSEYPEGKAGYYAWRTYLYGFHGDKAGAIMSEVGYDDATIASVKRMMLKKDLKNDADSATLEDAAALVFLENHIAEFADREDMDEPKLINIVQMTWGKMSEKGHAAALELVLPDHCAALVQKALGA
jgi:hypothetical protein